MFWYQERRRADGGTEKEPSDVRLVARLLKLFSDVATVLYNLAPFQASLIPPLKYGAKR